MDHDPNDINKWMAIPACIKAGDEEIAYGGLFFASKRDEALIGMEGALKMEFENSNTFTNGVFLGYSVPLAQGKNNCLISYDKYNNAKDFFDKNQSHFNQGDIEEDNSKYVQTFMSSPKGGDICMISVVKEK